MRSLLDTLVGPEGMFHVALGGGNVMRDQRPWAIILSIIVLLAAIVVMLGVVSLVGNLIGVLL